MDVKQCNGIIFATLLNGVMSRHYVSFGISFVILDTFLGMDREPGTGPGSPLDSPGGQAIHQEAGTARLPDYPAGGIDSLPSVDALAKRFAALAASTRKAIDSAEQAGDMDTADLFTEVSRGLDKSLWFLEAHLQG
jgi:hypothetical protein